MSDNTNTNQSREEQKKVLKRVWKESRVENPVNGDTKFEEWYSRTSEKYPELKSLDKKKTVEFYFDKKIRRITNPQLREAKKKLKASGVKVNIETKYEEFYQAATKAINDIASIKIEYIQEYFNKQQSRARKALGLEDKQVAFEKDERTVGDVANETVDAASKAINDGIDAAKNLVQGGQIPSK
ncbi:E3 ubiquitin-protein ligase [Acrasis kona]|uniref:E3 ubiquitin-protein ligase n=1 Tax=Acrasis kona TaxID=1008807 RepID=A0AAW2YLW8_9EUKA